MNPEQTDCPPGGHPYRQGSAVEVSPGVASVEYAPVRHSEALTMPEGSWVLIRCARCPASLLAGPEHVETELVHCNDGSHVMPAAGPLLFRTQAKDPSGREVSGALKSLSTRSQNVLRRAGILDEQALAGADMTGLGRVWACGPVSLAEIGELRGLLLAGRS